MARQRRSTTLGLLAIVAGACAAVQLLLPLGESFVQPPAPTSGAHLRRREMLLVPAGVLAVGAQAAGAAVAPCKDDANNCFSTANAAGKTKMSPWVWPKDMSRADAIASLKSVVEAYPKAGQDGVDLGGWSYAVDELADKGYARLEFLSGIGNFARFFNGGKPFVDDFEVQVEDDKVSVKSASRVGDSDFGVNGKRINFIAAGLRAKGWTAPGI